MCAKYYVAGISFDSKNALQHHGIIGQKWGVKNGPPYPIKGYQSVDHMLKAMGSFKYKEFDRLMSADEVGRTKTGSCHDQVMYEMQQLRRLGKNPKGLFVMEYGGDQGGMTHSIAYYEEDGKVHWVEPPTTWPAHSGDTPYPSLDSIKNTFIKEHDAGNFGNKNSYQNIIFGEFNDSDHKIGEDLQEFVDICLKNA